MDKSLFEKLMEAGDGNMDIGNIDIDAAVAGYMEAAAWTEEDQLRNDLQDLGGEFELAPDTQDKMRADVIAFVKEADLLLIRAGIEAGQAGHDFWLTRNGHGAGFWDRGNGDVGDELTKMCQTFGEYDLYVGDDGLVHGQ